MKLKKDFVTHMDGEQQMMVDTSARFSGLVRNNKTAAFIVELLKTDTTKDKIIEAMLNKYDVEESVVRNDVRRTIKTLKDIGALE